MGADTILRSQVMVAINTGKLFDLTWVLCDVKRGVAGKVKRVKQWAKLKDDELDGVVPGRFSRKTDIKRHQDYWKNKTFIIFDPLRKSQHPITVHYRLMLEYNGQRIING